MAAEYAAKLALLHEESAARADTDRRKRRERYIMLADLQTQAKVFPQFRNVECGLYVNIRTACGNPEFGQACQVCPHAPTKGFCSSLLYLTC